MRILRRLLQVVFTLLTLVAILIGVLAFAAFRAVPNTRGIVTLAAGDIAAPVTIVRDARGVPTIEARTEDDAYFALGYAHAQDRLFQMELMRRSGQGRLSEVIGKPGLGTDRFIRTLGLYRRATADFEGLDPAVRRVFQRYADGVNAWLRTRGRPLPIEFQLLWFTPEPWTPVDSLVWQKLMGLQLAGNWEEELLRASLDTKLGPARTEALFAQPRPDDPVTVRGAPVVLKTMNTSPPRESDFAGLEPTRLLRVLLRAVTPTLASNALAISGTRTASGKPILANDPHLGFQIPSLWYLVILKTPNLTLTGATVPGVPLHILGHNGHVAWGITTTHADTNDLFVERVLTGGTNYETPEGPKPFATHRETIAVRFSKSTEIAVRETRHGPVLSDILRPGEVPAALRDNDRVLALASALLQPDDRSAEGIYRMARAADASAFREALRLFHAPMQNIMFADARSIGFVAAGRVPLRKAGDGTIPAPGWDGASDWTGMVPFDDLPQVIDPPDGVIVNANNRVIGPGGPLIAAHWPDAYRARRILALVNGASKPLTPADIAGLQQDIVSLAATEMLPLVLPHVQPRTDAERALLEALKTWDGTMARDRAEPLVFAVWMDRLKSALLADDLGGQYGDLYGGRLDELRNMLTAPAEGAIDWCDAVNTPARETCPARVQLAWNEGIDWVAARDHRLVTEWRWEDFHRAAFGHIAFQGLPVLGRLTSRTIGTPGAEHTINRGSYRDPDSPRPLGHVHGPGFRAVYDLADLAGSRYALAGGESGHPASPHYDNLLEPWRDGVTFPLVPTGGPDGDSLTLAPGAAGKSGQ